MQFFAIMLVLQIIAAGLFLNLSSNSPQVAQVKHAVKQVLGVSLLAQENSTPTDTPTPEDTPTDTPTDVPTDTPTPTDVQAQTTNITPTPTLSQSETSLTPLDTSTTQTGSSLSPTPEDTPSEETPSPSLNDSITPSITSIETTDTTTSSVVNDAILNPDAMISTPANVNSNIITQAQQQDTEIAHAASPVQQTTLLVQAAKENVISISDSLSQNDYSTVSYLTQRITDEVNKAVTNVSNSAPNNQINNKIDIFCKQADLSLKTQQQLVPEELESDIEIVRGMCAVQ